MTKGTKLGFFALLALGLNGIVGVGIFFTPNQVSALLPGTAGALAYLFTTLALVPVACVYAKLGARFAEDGGPYVWARAAFGPAAGFFVGWVTYVSAVLAAATITLGLCQFLGPSLGFVSPSAKLAFGWLCVAVLGAIVVSGLRPSAWAWSCLTVAKLVPLGLLVVLYVVSSHAPLPSADASGFSWGNLGRAMLIASFPLQGFEIVAVVAGSAQGSRQTVPRATLASLVLAAMLYVVLQLACVSGVPQLASSQAPLVAAADAYGGSAAADVVATGTNLSALGIAFGMLAMTPRYLSTLGREDGLGSWLGVETAQRVPLRAVLITTVLLLALISLARFAELLALASLAALIQYAVSAASLAKLALAEAGGLSRRDIWPAPLALAAIVLVAHSAELSELWVLAGVSFLGALLFVARSWNRARLARAGEVS